MDELEFRQLLALGHEQQGIEFKGPGSRIQNRRLQAQVIRAMLGMANKRDGGLIILGISEDDDGKPIPVGLSSDELSSWRYDDLASSLSEYADPSIEFDVDEFEYEENAFIIIRVDEFRNIPILCTRTYESVLRKGACYVRSRKKPETTEIPTQTDMRNLLDLAIEKGLRSFVTLANRAGLQLVEPAQEVDQSKFEDQLDEFLRGIP